MKKIITLSLSAACLLVLNAPVANAGLNSAGTEWTVESGDTLYNIARRIAPNSGKQQAAVRKHMKMNSPKAFRGGNYNSLEIGDILSVPTGFADSQPKKKPTPKPKPVVKAPVLAAPVVVPKPAPKPVPVAPTPKPVPMAPVPAPEPVVATPEPAPTPVVDKPTKDNNPYVSCERIGQSGKCDYWKVPYRR